MHKNNRDMVVWIGCMAVLGGMSYMKTVAPAPESCEKEIAVIAPVVRWQIPHLSNGKTHLAQHAVTVEEFQRFVLDTNYRTLRERQDLSPTWRDEAGSARWLCREDAEAYCKWLTRLWGGKIEARLPSVDELAWVRDSVDFDVDWEWTAQSLHDVDPEFSGGHRYLTAWNLSSAKMRHRRTQDMAFEDSEPTTFRVAWDSRTAAP